MTCSIWPYVVGKRLIDTRLTEDQQFVTKRDRRLEVMSRSRAIQSGSSIYRDDVAYGDSKHEKSFGAPRRRPSPSTQGRAFRRSCAEQKHMGSAAVVVLQGRGCIAETIGVVQPSLGTVYTAPAAALL